MTISEMTVEVSVSSTLPSKSMRLMTATMLVVAWFGFVESGGASSISVTRPNVRASATVTATAPEAVPQDRVVDDDHPLPDRPRRPLPPDIDRPEDVAEAEARLPVFEIGIGIIFAISILVWTVFRGTADKRR